MTQSSNRAIIGLEVIMPLKDPYLRQEYEKSRYPIRRQYWREYRRKHPRKNQYVGYGQSLGYKGEELALNVLVGSKRIYRPSDLEWTGKRVEVKTSIKYSMPDTKNFRWKFYLNRQVGKVDLFFLICEDKDKKVEFIFLIPESEITVKNLSIAESKIHKYSRFLLSL